MKQFFCLFFLVSIYFAAFSQKNKVDDYINDINKYGQSPVEFVRNAVEKHDLIIFDDALHSAYEPFVFYNQLMQDSVLSKKINLVFLEVISTVSQPALDSFLNNAKMDTSLLLKAFQDDYTGYGWRYQTYIDLLKTIWQHNKLMPAPQKIKVIGVNPPIYWEALHSKEQYDIFENTLDERRDYSIYVEIRNAMESFRKNIKALFITNTRHAYKKIRNKDGEVYWNTATLFNHWYPGKAYSVRIHNVSLSIQRILKKETDSSLQTVKTEYKWVKIDDGLWDSAFALNHNKPVAVPFQNTQFGKTAYIGNHMLNVAVGTTMNDAYDATIFLAPITQLHFSAQFNFIYTQKFKTELERRVRLLEGNNYENFLKENQAKDFEEYYQKAFMYIPVSPNTLVK